MLDCIEMSRRGQENLHEIVAEKRAKYRFFEDLYFPDNLVVLLEKELEVVDDNEKGE